MFRGMYNNLGGRLFGAAGMGMQAGRGLKSNLGGRAFGAAGYGISVGRAMKAHPVRTGAGAVTLGGVMMYRRRSSGRNGLEGQSSGGMYY